MVRFNTYSGASMPDADQEKAIADFLFQHLDSFGDPLEDICKAMDYALGRHRAPGGLMLTAADDSGILGAVVLNRTGMSRYIPENILVYIATHGAHRGEGLGRKLMQAALDAAEGSIALHVEPENPALRLYESLGFTNKYLEMRLQR